MSDNRGVGLRGWLAGPADKSAQRKNEPVVKPLRSDPDRHRIAVLPLLNISPKPEDDYFAEGAGGKEVTLENLPFTAVPNQTTVVAKSKKLSFHDHGMDWNVSGKNGFYMPFAFKGP